MLGRPLLIILISVLRRPVILNVEHSSILCI